MIKQLQRRFIAISMLSLLIVLLLVLTVVNGINIYNQVRRCDSVIDVLAENKGTFPSEEHSLPGLGKKKNADISEETPFETRYFVVMTDSSGEITSIDTGHVAAVTSDAAAAYAQEVFDGSRERGYEDDYRFRRVALDDGTYLLIFVDAGNALSTARSFLLNSMLVAGVSMVILFVIVSVLSRRAVKPFVENVERQKRFITDAAHGKKNF